MSPSVMGKVACFFSFVLNVASLILVIILCGIIVMCSIYSICLIILLFSCQVI